MKIAIISTLHNPILPAFPGGIEVFNYYLSSELSKKNRKHEVTLLASGGSETRAKLYAVCPRPLFEMGLEPNESQNMRRIIYLENHYYIKAMEYVEKNNFDIIHHSHTSFLPIYLGYKAKIPQVLTMHMTANSNITLNIDIKEFINDEKNLGIISISKCQARILKELKFFANIYNGICLDDFTYSENPEDYFGWLGRIAPNKGTKEAIELALKAGVKLKIAGTIGVGKIVNQYFVKIEKKYFKNPYIDFLGPVDLKARNQFLSNAKAILSPIQWEEPFGLVMIEAMACGTPVIAFERGSVSEIIKDGVTGFICLPGDSDCMVRAIKKINEMPADKYLAMRQACRKHVEENFTVEKMVDGYEKVYQKVINDWKSKHEQS